MIPLPSIPSLLGEGKRYEGISEGLKYVFSNS
jgi:hypothetical protein